MLLIDQLRDCLGSQYDIERELGGGGMSRVYVAMERALSRRVVVKVLAPELGQSVNVDRFRQEIATLAKLQHPQIIPVYGAGRCGDLLYYIMPFVAGESLREMLVRTRGLTPQDTSRMLTSLARALSYAHREGVVHRDIKPENILLAQGEPMLADFGIAKIMTEGAPQSSNLTSMGTSIGTVTYMAPEQVVADPTIDGRADVYSLAAVGFELLSGRPPFSGTLQQVMSAHVVKAPPSLAELVPGLPDALRIAIERGLTKEASERPDATTFAAMLESAATTASHLTPATTAQSAVPDTTREKIVRAPAPARSRRALIGGVAAVIGLALGGVWWNTGSKSNDTSTGTAAAPVTLAPAVAVLPFETVGDQKDDRYFAVGLTDELMTAITRVQGLRVISRGTVRAYADSVFTPKELGGRLGARMLVEGSVQRAGKRLRITASLVDVTDGSAIWSERYDREMSDVFATQSEISQSIVTALAPKLGIAPAEARSTSGTNSPEAYDLFLRARFAFDARELRPAIGYFRQAIALDVRFARAYSGIAEALALLPQYGAGNYAQLRDSIQLVAGQALALDSTLSGPHTALGLLAKGAGDWSTGEQELARAVALQPNDGPAHQNVGELLFTIGRFDDAARALSRAAQLEPASATIVGEFAFALLLTSQLDSAERTIDRALQLDGRQAYLHFTKSLIAERRGRYADAIPPLVAAIDRSSLPFFIGVLARAQYQAGKVAEARTTREQVGALGNVAGTALARAIADSPTGEPSRMLDDLERAAAEHDPLMFLLPFRLWWFDRVRNDPRFAALLKSLHLPVTAGEQMPAVVK